MEWFCFNGHPPDVEWWYQLQFVQPVQDSRWWEHLLHHITYVHVLLPSFTTWWIPFTVPPKRFFARPRFVQRGSHFAMRMVIVSFGILSKLKVPFFGPETANGLNMEGNTDQRFARVWFIMMRQEENESHTLQGTITCPDFGIWFSQVSSPTIYVLQHWNWNQSLNNAFSSIPKIKVAQDCKNGCEAWQKGLSVALALILLDFNTFSFSSHSQDEWHECSCQHFRKHRCYVGGSEIPHHLGCMKKTNENWDSFHINWWSPDFLTINSIRLSVHINASVDGSEMQKPVEVGSLSNKIYKGFFKPIQTVVGNLGFLNHQQCYLFCFLQKCGKIPIRNGQDLPPSIIRTRSWGISEDEGEQKIEANWIHVTN